MDIENLSIKDSRDLLLKGEITSKELVEEHFKKIEEKKDLNSFISLNKEEALAQAEEIDRKIGEKEELKSLSSVTVALGDNIVSKGLRTTAASKMLENYIPVYDASVVERLKEEDALILGKTNMDEFGLARRGKTSYFGPVKNPINPDRIAGGSSAGAAASVASGQVQLALASDTGGSVRQPAAFCGLVGMKPSYGLVSKSGLIALANSMDQIGILARRVEDVKTMLEVIGGEDPKDPTTVGSKLSLSPLEGKLEGIKIGLIKEYFEMDMDQELKAEVLGAVEEIKALGAEVDYVSIPSLNYALTSYNIMELSELSSNLSRFDGIRYGYRTENYSSMEDIYKNSRKEGFGWEVKRRILAGTYLLSQGRSEDYHKRALKIRGLIKDEFDEVYKDYDLLISPTNPYPAEEISRESSLEEDYAINVFTVAASLLGLPALSLPCGDLGGLPVGMQLMANRFEDEKLLDIAYGIEGKLNYGGER